MIEVLVGGAYLNDLYHAGWSTEETTEYIGGDMVVVDTFPGIFLSTHEISADVMLAMNKATRDWELRAARGECSWMCADCSCTFPEGMPDACEWGHKGCTDLINRDKMEAKKEDL